MPNRILREGILASEPVNELGWAEECFYRRLHSVVDDFGRYSAHPSLLRAACYPLRLNDVSDQDVGKWLAVCATKGLVRVYQVDGKRYLEVTKFEQRMRAKKSKCPQFDDTCQSSDGQQSDDCLTHAHGDGDGGGIEDEKTNVGQEARRILAFLNEKAGRRYQENKTNLDFIKSRLKEGATVTECRQVIVKKCREWKGDPKMELYLRPATLFNKTKFSQYQGELVALPGDFPT